MIFEYRLQTNDRLMLKTFLLSGVSNIYPISTTSFNLNSYNLPATANKIFASIGFKGTDSNELLEVISNSTNTITTSPSTKTHKANEPVFLTEAYKARLFNSSTIDGSYTAVSDSILFDYSTDQTIKFDISNTTGFFKVVLVGNDGVSDILLENLQDVEPFEIQNNSQSFSYTTEADITVLLPTDLKVPPQQIIKCIRKVEAKVNTLIANIGCSIPMTEDNINYGLVKSIVEDAVRCCILKYAKCDCTQEQSESDYNMDKLAKGEYFRCSSSNGTYVFKCRDKCSKCNGCGCNDCDECRILRRDC